MNIFYIRIKLFDKYVTIAECFTLADAVTVIQSIRQHNWQTKCHIYDVGSKKIHKAKGI